MSTEVLSVKPEGLPGRWSIWRHKKGTLYRVIEVSRHSERPDWWLVTYQPVEGGESWTRALVMSAENQWPGFMDPDRFEHVSGPRTWRDEELGARPSYDELLNLLDDVSAAAETMLLHHGQAMPSADRVARGLKVGEARALCDALLR